MTAQENVRDVMYQEMLNFSFSNMPYIIGNWNLNQSLDFYQERGVGWACLEAARYCVNAMGAAGRDVTFHTGYIPSKGWPHFAAIDHEDGIDSLLDAGMLVDRSVEIPKFGEHQVSFPSKGVRLVRDGDNIDVYFVIAGRSPQNPDYRMALTPGKIPDFGKPQFTELGLVRLQDGVLYKLSYGKPGKVEVRKFSRTFKSQTSLSSFSEIADLFRVDEELLRAANEIVRATPSGKPIKF